jgi:hypothetical protein
MKIEKQAHEKSCQIHTSNMNSTLGNQAMGVSQDAMQPFVNKMNKWDPFMPNIEIGQLTHF